MGLIMAHCRPLMGDVREGSREFGTTVGYIEPLAPMINVEQGSVSGVELNRLIFR